MKSALKQGQSLVAVWGAMDQDGNQFAASCKPDAPDYCRAKLITVSQCAGPMGWYDVAVVEREDGRSQMVPIHMMETVEIADPEVK